MPNTFLTNFLFLFKKVVISIVPTVTANVIFATVHKKRFGTFIVLKSVYCCLEQGTVQFTLNFIIRLVK